MRSTKFSGTNSRRNEGAGMAGPREPKYRAFISYSHADTKWAKWLHSALEAFRIDQDLVGRETAMGKIPAALRPIFRDRDEFTAGHTLNDQTIAALDDSAAMIVMCSPKSAESRYVNEEIRLFKQRHPGRPIIPVIVAGRPGGANDNCIPPALQFKLGPQGQITTTPEPDILAADVGEDADGKDLALAKVIARLLGLGTDDVFRRAERERLRDARARLRVAIAISCLSLAVGGVSIAWLKQDFIKHQINWWRSMRPYMEQMVRPHVLTASAELALKKGMSFRECKANCPEMIVIPPGEFTMGSPDNEIGHEPAEGPQHKVVISKRFAVSKFEVTFDDWQACVGVGGCVEAPESDAGKDNHPVVNIKWSDAKQYTEWLTLMTGKEYRLLSESEWEYAARAGTNTAYSWGPQIGVGHANCMGCGSKWDKDQSAPAGSFAPNDFGLHDMHGNVWEWCEDFWHGTYENAPQDGSAWLEGGKSRHVLRGGSSFGEPDEVRSANRYAVHAGVLGDAYGFRVARTLLPPGP
jgi:formylglycine-generating enzyme required for sulfatase activity